jgi:hypothetical protein
VSPTWWIPSKTPLPRLQPSKLAAIGETLEFVTLGPAQSFLKTV